MIALRALAPWLLALAIGAPGIARAEAPARAGQAKKPAAGKVLQSQELEVEGRIQKPTVKPLTPPPNAIPGKREQPESLLPRILEALDKDPF